MSRLPYLRREELDDQGRGLWDSLTSNRGSWLVNEEGGLMGPFNAWVHAPDAGARLAQLGLTLRFGTSLERRLSELAIITVGARWRAEFEWWAHAPMARDHGVGAAIVDAIARGEEPAFEADDERAVYRVARELSETGGLSEPVYTEAQQLFGDRAMVELVSLCGYYTLVSFTLNAFAVPLPAGAEPVWNRA